MTPLCVGKHALFDSTDPGDHDQARKICASCPVTDWCEQQAQRARDQAPSITPYPLLGTWAGRLYGGNVVNETRIATENAMFTEDEAREAHAAWGRGVRDDRTRIGERVYQRTRARHQREQRKVAA